MTPIEPTDSELLTSYVVAGSEAAFGQLVRRHLGLVYSAALRQLGGHAATAEDVTQLVFTALARETDRLRRRGSIAGWLHTTTRHLSAKARRGDERRLLRETTALTMNPPATEDAVWEEMCPLLDTALHELPDTDREAVLLRFFEKLSLGEVGSRLGVGEDAARKRVDRALDKLRGLLAKRGVTSATAAALAALLLDRASAAPPIQLATEATATALKASVTVASGGLLAWFLGWPAKVALVAGLAAIVASVAIQRSGSNSSRFAAAPNPSPAIAAPGSLAAAPDGSAASSQTPKPALAEEDTKGQLKLLLYLVDAATDKPVTGGMIELVLFTTGGIQNLTLQSDTNGYCRVYYPVDVKSLEVVTRIDGFADSRLRWAPEKGAFVPPDYTWRLYRPVSIGGWVVDEAGKPVAGAEIGFSIIYPGMDDIRPEETDPVTFPQVTSDGAGRWTLSRMSASAVRKAEGFASHPDFGPPATANGAGDGEKLLDGTFRFVLKDGFTVGGLVADSSGQPVPQARVFVGNKDEIAARTAITDSDGRFSISKCRPGEQPVTASAEGFAPSTQWLEVGSNMSPVRLTLDHGATLLLKIVDSDNKPIPNAGARLNPWPNPWTKSVQTTFSGRADDEGRIVWSNAPAGALYFDVGAKGFATKREVELHASGEEQIVALGNRFRVIGDVWDAVTGRPIGRFKAGAATSWTNLWKGAISLNLENGDDFSGGHFEKEFDSGPIVVRVEADGYRSYLSRSLTADEGEVRLDVRLQQEPIRTVTLLDPDGRPLPRADVLLIESNWTVSLVPGGFKNVWPVAVSVVRTDTQGRFLVPSRDEIELLASASEEGLATARPAELGSDTMLRMRRWGRVTGSLYSRGKPDANGVVKLVLAENNPSLYCGVVPDSTIYRAEADEMGRFEFPKAPPGEWRIQQVKETRISNNAVGWSTMNSKLVQIPAGGTVDVVIGEGGTTVRAVVAGDPMFLDSSRNSLWGSVLTANVVPPIELSWEVIGQHQWAARPENRRIQKLARSYPTVKEGLAFTATDVLPGDYVFRILAVPNIDNDKRTGNAVAAVGMIRFTVPDPAPTEGIDLGEIRLEPVKP